MLPFLKMKKDQNPGVSTVLRPSDDPESDDGMQGIIAAMKDFCDAKDSNDYKGMAQAFQAAFDMLEMMPHDEVSHEDSEENQEPQE